MWCRTILTAVAISYVICMLLWSGLQKEDLDPNILEKLGRYNVNIDDMNNQQLRQECLVPHVTTEVQREALRTPTVVKRNQNDVTVGIFPKIGVLLAANFEDRTVIQNKLTNTAKENFVQFPVSGQDISDSGNSTKNLSNKGIIKIEYNIQNQPNVESVMNFWTKLSRYTRTVIPTTTTEEPITTTTQTHKAKNITDIETYNTGYVHSREMEYINRILAEYLASQTIPTTTQTVATKKVFPNYFPIKYREMSSKASVEEERNRLNVQKEVNKINNVTKNQLHRISVATYSQSQKNEPKVREPMPVKRNKTTGILEKLLQMRNDLFNNGVIISETESSTETIKITNKNKHFQETSDSFNLFKLFQNINKNNFNNDHSKSASIIAETWKPVPLTDENINKESKASPVDNKETIHEQKFVMFDLFKTTPSKITVPERTKTYHEDNQIEDVKKANLHKNAAVEEKGSRFQAMLPSIKYSKENKNRETSNSQIKGVPTDFNKVQESGNVQLLTAKKTTTSQQPVTLEKFARNQLFKMKYDTFDADKAEIEPKDYNAKQFKKALVFQTTNPTDDSKKIKAIQEIINNFDRDNEQLTLDKVNNSKATQNVNSVNMSDVQAIQSNFIKEIAEKVKQIVLKDIGGEVPNTTEGTTPTVTVPTTVHSTSTSTKVSTTEKPSTSLQKEFAQTNHVMHDLMEIFKELKAMKDNVKLTNQAPQNTTAVMNGTKNLPQWPVQPYPETPAPRNPYLMRNPTIFNPIQVNSDPRILPLPMSSGVEQPQNKAPRFMPPLNSQPTKDYQFGAITIQTNSDEIAPLPIQLSKPLRAMNQHIVVTTKRTVDKLTVERERNSIKHINDNYRIPNENINLRGKLKSDLPKRVQLAEKHEFRDRYFRGRYLDREKPWYNHEYHEKVHNMENNHPVRTRFPELHYPGRLTHLEHSGRPRDLSNSEDFKRPRGHNRPGFKEPRYQQNGMRPHPGSHGSSDYDRRPRYEATKFHEKLERIDNWPRNAWKDFHSPSDSSNDEISARQQVPLVKVKQRTRYDDTHFTNFLKTQQKVTDMLEKLLANNIKNSGPHSVETP